MKPIEQTILNHDLEKGIKGNCLQACIASLFELPLESVPHFVMESEEEWALKFIDFIYEQGYIYEGFAPIEKLNDVEMNRGVDGYLIVTGISFRGFSHATIYKDGKLVHDPYPTKLGLKEEQGFHMIKRGKQKGLSNPWRLFM